jgi:hypothetical protein
MARMPAVAALSEGPRMILSALESTRDVIIIIWGLISILAFLLFIIFLLVLWRGIRRLTGDVQAVVREDIRPMLATTRESATNVAGTARFVGDTVVTPIIRLYGIIAGIRRWVAVFTGLRRRGRRERA